MDESVKHQFVSAPLSSLALGIASIGWVWDLWLDLGGVVKVLSAMIAVCLLLMLTVQYIRYPAQLKQELSDPVTGTSMPTISMALLVISHSISLWNPMVGCYVWVFAIAVHIMILFGFLMLNRFHFTLNCINPGWFVPFVGIMASAITYPGGFPKLIDWILVWSLVCYSALVPLMMYRLIWGDSVELRALPTIAVLAAPGSLLLAGYLTVMFQPSPMIVSLLFGVSTLMTATVYISLYRLLRLPFSMGFASYTFPTVISASALFKLAGWLESLNIDPSYSLAIKSYAQLELFLSTAIMIYVISRMFGVFWKLKQAVSV